MMKERRKLASKYHRNPFYFVRLLIYSAQQQCASWQEGPTVVMNDLRSSPVKQLFNLHQVKCAQFTKVWDIV